MLTLAVTMMSDFEEIVTVLKQIEVRISKWVALDVSNLFQSFLASLFGFLRTFSTICRS